MRGRTYVGLGLVTLGITNHLGKTWGSTREERALYLPSDDLVTNPQIATNHAITIRGRAEDVWPWLIQMGWHRAGWYTYRWVDRLLFSENDPSADRIVPELQDLEEGDHIPDGSPETGVHFVVDRLDVNKMMVLRSRTHLPPFPKARWLNWVWTYRLEETDSDHVRLMLRTRARIGPWWLRNAYRASLWTDFVMARSHLRGIKRRVENG